MTSVRTLRPAEVENVRARAEDLGRAGSPAAALALMTAAAEDLEPHNSLAAAVLLAEASWYAFLASGPNRSLAFAERAAALAGDDDGPAALIVHARLGDALQWSGRYAEAQAEWRRAAGVPSGRDPRLLAGRADALLRAGDVVAARETAYAATARARATGEGDWLRDALTFQVTAEVHLGLLREADASAKELLAVAGPATSGDRAEALGVLAWTGALLVDEGECLSRIAAAEATLAELRVTAIGGLARGLLALRSGRYEEAVTYLEARLFGTQPVAAAISLRPFLDGLVEAAMRAGRVERARELVAEAFEPAVATGQPRYAAVAFRMQALASTDLGGFETALDHHGAWGNRFEEARTRLAYGEALRRAKRRKDAREQLSAATSKFGAVGADAWARRARDELRAAGARLPREASGVPLTPQEQRIARLVAEGLSNKEIALRLVVTTKTVEGHLRNIFEKLGVRSRTQIARALSR